MRCSLTPASWKPLRIAYVDAPAKPSRYTLRRRSRGVVYFSAASPVGTPSSNSSVPSLVSSCRAAMERRSHSKTSSLSSVTCRGRSANLRHAEIVERSMGVCPPVLLIPMARNGASWSAPPRRRAGSRLRCRHGRCRASVSVVPPSCLAGERAGILPAGRGERLQGGCKVFSGGRRVVGPGGPDSRGTARESAARDPRSCEHVLAGVCRWWRLC